MSTASGTILLPGLPADLPAADHPTASLFMFGWAKPVPVSAWKFRDPRRGMALVAVAGPAMNFFLAWVAALLLPAPSAPCRQRPGLSGRGDRAASGRRAVPVLLHADQPGARPVQPAADPAARRRPDRGRPAAAASWRARWARLERLGIVLVILVVFLLPHLIPGFDPFGQALNTVVPWAIRSVAPAGRARYRRDAMSSI